MIAEHVTIFLVGAFVGAAIVRQYPRPPRDFDAALEAYRDAAASFCEAVLKGFGSTTEWDRFRQAREVYLVESQGEDLSS
jgi:hypothetical protein